MKTLIHALVVGVFATAASAQTAAPTTDNKAKQETVKAATEKTTGHSGKAAAEGSAKAAADKTPRPAPPKMSEHEEALKKAATK